MGRWILVISAMLSLAVGVVSPAMGQCISPESPYGINAHAPQGSGLPVLLDEVRACGIGWIRIDFVWAWAEPAQDTFSWAIYDQIAAAAAARGLHVFATISHTPAWATNGSEGTGVPRSAADYADICRRAATRYAGVIDHWGMWNEANLTQFWAGTRADYINLILIPGADAVHAGNPAAKVCGPELAHLSSADWDDWLADCIAQAGPRLDIVTHHAYADSFAGVTSKLEKPKFWPWDSPSVKQVLQAAGWLGKPLWLTETGWESADVGEAAQAAAYTGLLSDWFSGQPGRDWVDKVFFYELHDSQAFSTISFGILGRDPAYPRKPAFSEYQAFTSVHPPPPVVPGPVSGPTPVHNAVGVPTHADLSWSAGTCAGSYEVFFGPGDGLVLVSVQSGTGFDPGPLQRLTRYSWRVDGLNGTVRTPGPTWRFTTAGAPADYDLDGDVDQSDFGTLQACISGSGEPRPDQCGPADLDGDWDVDGADVVVFQGCMHGSNRPPGC